MNQVNNLFGEKVEEGIFFQIYNEYYPKLYKYALYRVADPNIAEDLVSEVFEKLLLKYNIYSPQGRYEMLLKLTKTNLIQLASMNFEQVLNT